MKASLRRKLQALDHPSQVPTSSESDKISEEFDINDSKTFRTLVAWLEDRKIRQLDPAARSGLRTIEADSKWDLAMQTYLDSLECPFQWKDAIADSDARSLILDWLLGVAINFEYEDRASQESSKPIADSPQDINLPLHLDTRDPDIRRAVESLAETLGVDRIDDTELLLQTCCRCATQWFSPMHIAAIQQLRQSGDSVNLDSLPLGFETGNPALDRVARVLRVLYAGDLRNLQTKINQLIVEIQEFTAHPKTDARLGKVGR